MSDDEQKWNDKRETLELSIGSLLDELFAHMGTKAMKSKTPNGVEFSTAEYKELTQSDTTSANS